MIDKSKFLNSFEDETEAFNIYNKILLFEKIDQDIFTDEFYPPQVWSNLLKMNFDFYINTYGVFEDSERRMISFSYDEFEKEYPLKFLKIINKSKFKNLEHKDYLGSLMSLGIKREFIGDLIIKENECFFPASLKISNFIIENLSFIGKNPIEIEELDLNNVKIPDYNFKNFDILSCSLRLDAIISEITNLSRNESEKLINSKKVLLNYTIVDNKSKIINLPSSISIRKYGKFIIEKIIGENKKGKLKISVKKFI